MPPQGDGTGPRGLGSGTGRGSGQCGGRREKKVGRWRGLLSFFQGSYREDLPNGKRRALRIPWRSWINPNARVAGSASITVRSRPSPWKGRWPAFRPQPVSVAGHA